MINKLSSSVRLDQITFDILTGLNLTLQTHLKILIEFFTKIRTQGLRISYQLL
jgi:hypothetical protein